MNEFNYGENLRKIRELMEISQEEMAFRLKISGTTYAWIERQVTLDEQMAEEIAYALGGVPADMISPFEQMDSENLRIIRSMEAEQEIREFLKTPVGIIIILGASIFIVNAIYEGTRGFCAGLETSAITILVASWTAALATAGVLYYSVKRVRRVAPLV